MNLQDFLNHHWLTEDSKASDIVFSSRIRLARNLNGYPFPGRANEEQRFHIESLVLKTLEDLPLHEKTHVIHLEQLTALERQFLFERHLISHQHAQAKGRRAVVVSEEERLSLMINEEDHLRLQVLYPGLALEQALKDINHIDDELLERLPIAFSTEKGFLTECPTNVGTGMRASVMLHLPGLVYLKRAEHIFEATAKLGLTVRGFYGEGSSALGCIYQISNQVTLGLKEEDIVQKLWGIVQQVIAHERSARELLLKEKRLEIEDRVYRSLGILQNARLLSYAEAIDLLSTIWLGCGINLVSGLNEKKIYDLFFLVQPAHLQMLEKQVLAPELRDERRANLVRKYFNIV